jgi:hypothetical protein
MMRLAVWQCVTAGEGGNVVGAGVGAVVGTTVVGGGLPIHTNQQRSIAGEHTCALYVGAAVAAGAGVGAPLGMTIVVPSGPVITRFLIVTITIPVALSRHSASNYGCQTTIRQISVGFSSALVLLVVLHSTIRKPLQDREEDSL